MYKDAFEEVRKTREAFYNAKPSEKAAAKAAWMRAADEYAKKNDVNRMVSIDLVEKQLQMLPESDAAIAMRKRHNELLYREQQASV